MALTIWILGGGLMGSQIATEFAVNRHTVKVATRRVDVGNKRVAEAISSAISYGILNTDTATEVKRHITVTSLPIKSGPPPDLILETLPEHLDLKIDVLARPVDDNRHAVVASNTSSLSISEIGRRLEASDRTLGMHYWNPPILMPLVEVVAGEGTKTETVARAQSILRSIGKRPVIVRRDVPGFIWNRLQFALLREALWLVENDVCDEETVDVVVRDGLARRSRLTGPFETAAIGGIETFRRVATNLFPQLSCAQTCELPDSLARDAEELAALRERRDQELALNSVVGPS